jgi:hypothetical protein
VNINVPAVLLNGVCVYDMRTREYIKTEAIERLSRSFLFETLSDFGISGFAYTFENGGVAYYYENLDTEIRKSFHDERSGRYGRVYKQIGSFNELCEKNLVYFSAYGDYAALAPVYKKLKADASLRIEFYHNIYSIHNENFWFLEVCAAAASKYNGVMYLRKAYDFSRVVSFGDNLNDLPMFQASDEKYAVANAKPEVKENAASVIKSSEEDGVAKWLEENIL